MWSVVAIGLLAFVAHGEENADLTIQNMANSPHFTDLFVNKLIDKLVDRDPALLGEVASAAPQMIQAQLDREANRGTTYEWIKYNSEVDPMLAMEAEGAVAIMNERARLKAEGATNPSSQEEELAQTSTGSISLSAAAIMAFFVGSVLTLFARRFQSSSANKEAFMAGYSPFNA